MRARTIIVLLTPSAKPVTVRRIDPRIVIGTLPLFASLGRVARERLAFASSIIDAPRGTSLVCAGDVCTGLHVVVSGQVKISLRKNAHEEKVIDLLVRGDSFGESAMFGGRSYRVCAEALADSRLLHVRKEGILAELAHEPAFARATIERLSTRLGALLEDVESCTLQSGIQRVAAYLLRRFEDASSGADFAFPARKRVVASQLNLTQEHFSRILRELIGARAIEVDGRIVRVLDAARLRALAR